jgi:hypothetical protein
MQRLSVTQLGAEADATRDVGKVRGLAAGGLRGWFVEGPDAGVDSDQCEGDAFGGVGKPGVMAAMSAAISALTRISSPV